MATLLRRAQRRGEIPADRDVDFLAQLMPSMVFARALSTGRPVERTFLQRLIDEVLIPAATARATTPGARTTAGRSGAEKENTTHARQA